MFQSAAFRRQGNDLRLCTSVIIEPNGSISPTPSSVTHYCTFGVVHIHIPTLRLALTQHSGVAFVHERLRFSAAEAIRDAPFRQKEHFNARQARLPPLKPDFNDRSLAPHRHRSKLDSVLENPFVVKAFLSDHRPRAGPDMSVVSRCTGAKLSRSLLSHMTLQRGTDIPWRRAILSTKCRHREAESVQHLWPVARHAIALGTLEDPRIVSLAMRIRISLGSGRSAATVLTRLPSQRPLTSTSRRKQTTLDCNVPSALTSKAWMARPTTHRCPEGRLSSPVHLSRPTHSISGALSPTIAAPTANESSSCALPHLSSFDRGSSQSSSAMALTHQACSPFALLRSHAADGQITSSPRTARLSCLRDCVLG
ncbi:hypothetical protein BCV69DRAFT_164017 [Microstroma glucosiphilum]|uniref:Uncharacterized protein n=1 Tax=Pseudomicrostroma glucosiphilum TaxID=1684307 RepID=A0A316UA08_9BASI|nr:hypothetical protein BCV69DRAFT_164017 [Pseudomicrostroma glucosiphilum]PWN21243.1 hypothetical protein BCV69DRAFT_164017 [Pseudomicrostroma glucosiphilum]